jgi:hypothetical protein
MTADWRGTWSRLPARPAREVDRHRADVDRAGGSAFALEASVGALVRIIDLALLYTMLALGSIS